MKVYVAVPTLGKVRAGLVRWLLVAQENFLSEKVPVDGLIDLSIDRPVESNRNRIVLKFLSSDCTHLLMVDDDVIVPDDLIPRFIRHDKDVVAAAPLIWHPVLRRPTIFAFKGEHRNYRFVDPSKGLQRCDFVGSAVLMMKRRVVEELPKPLFKVVLDEKGRFEKGEDQYFCELAREHGFEIWVDCDVIAGQAKEVELLEVLQLLRGIQNTLLLNASIDPTHPSSLKEGAFWLGLM